MFAPFSAWLETLLGCKTRKPSDTFPFFIFGKRKTSSHSYSQQVLLWTIHKHTKKLKCLSSEGRQQKMTTAAEVLRQQRAETGEARERNNPNFISRKHDNFVHFVLLCDSFTSPPACMRGTTETFYLLSKNGETFEKDTKARRDDVAGNRIHHVWERLHFPLHSLSLNKHTKFFSVISTRSVLWDWRRKSLGQSLTDVMFEFEMTRDAEESLTHNV